MKIILIYVVAHNFQKKIGKNIIRRLNIPKYMAIFRPRQLKK